MEKINLIQFGLGNIGRRLVREISSNYGNLRYVGLVDSERYCSDLEGIGEERLERILRYKEEGREVRGFEEKPEDMRGIIKKGRALKNYVVVDVTDSREMFSGILYSLQNGVDVVTANKESLCVSFREYERLMEASGELKYEATVGAGFPLVATLNSLMNSGDEIMEIEGCFSGTLGYVLSELRRGEKFSQIIRKAREKGYTEPDPREDLAGRDMARKALILARVMRLKAELEDVERESLIPKKLEEVPLENFMKKVDAKEVEKKVKKARKENYVMKYVARIEREDGIKVGLKKFPGDSWWGNLEKGDRIAVIRTRKYEKTPLTIIGPGAGPKVTTSRILNDIFDLI